MVLRVWVVLILLFLFIPILLIFFYAFNTSNIRSGPFPGLTAKWVGATWAHENVCASHVVSLQAGITATVFALVLGSCAAFAIHRTAFFGREVISLLFVLPLALPGIITGIALNAFFSFNGISLSLLTIVVGHTTFCIVVVYNNVLARLRRTQGSLLEAAMDLGANGFQAFRDITLPLISTAVVAGGVLAFPLSFVGVNVAPVTARSPRTLPVLISRQISPGELLPEVKLGPSVGILSTG